MPLIFGFWFVGPPVYQRLHGPEAGIGFTGGKAGLQLLARTRQAAAKQPVILLAI
jgi:hypothetical protein